MMSMRMISWFKIIAIAVVVVTCFNTVLAVATGTNDVVSVQPDVQVCVPHVSANSTCDTELKEAISQLKSEYREQYNELKSVHGRFMTYVTILVAIVGLVLPVLSFCQEEKIRKEVDHARSRVESFEKSNLQFRKSEVRGALTTAKFAWVEFLDSMKGGKVQARKIVEPLYRIVDALRLATQVKEVQLLSECVNSIEKIIVDYDAVVKIHDGQHNDFKSFVVDKRILSGVPNEYDLVSTLGTKTKSLETVLGFFNEFGIKTFGEVS